MVFSLSNARKVAVELAHASGSIIHDNLELGIKREWKKNHTPVTWVDEKINTLVLDTIHSNFPTHSILSEEGSDLTRSKEYVWVCDPLDGTFPFMHGIPLSTFALALVLRGVPILGVIYDPFTDRLFVAEKGHGATLNEVPIHTSQSSEISKASIGVVYWRDNYKLFVKLIDKLTPLGVQFYDFRSIAYMDAMVAAGEFSATVFPGESAHDSAAAKIIVEEAGGIFTSLSGDDQRYDQSVHGHIAAANPAIYQQIRALIG